jgi:hypothetical protein
MKVGVKTMTRDMAMATVTDSKKRLRSDHVDLRIKMPNYLLFLLKRASKSRGRFTTDIITNIFQKYNPKMDLTKDPKGSGENLCKVFYRILLSDKR